MGAVWSKTLDEDFAGIPRELFEGVDGRSVVVTGATGLVGSLVIRALLYANETYGLAIKPVAVVRNPGKMKEIYGARASHVGVVLCDLAKDRLNIEGSVDYIVHGAAVTTSRVMVERPVDVIDLALRGTESVLDLAKEKDARVVFLSSMEAYGVVRGGEKTDERRLGLVDPLTVRACYPESKRMCENLCVAYYAQYGVESCVARLAQTFGAGVLPGENRAVVAFSRAASRGEEVTLRTRGLSEANYVYGSDAVTAILTLMRNGVSGEAYNVANEACHMTIADMAKLVVETVGAPGARVTFDVDESNSSGYAPDTKLFLDSSKLMGLGWKPQVDMPTALRRLVTYLGEVA